MEGSVKMEIVQETSRVPSLSSFWALGLGLAGEERGPVWKSEEMVLGLHPDHGQPGLEGRSESPKPVTHPEPLKRQQALCPCGKLTEECSQHHGNGSP